MHSPSTSDRRNGAGWLILAGVGTLWMLGTLLSYLADQAQRSGPSGAVAMMVFGGLACAVVGAVALGPIGRAVGKRILQGGAAPAATDEDVQDLRLHVEELRQALAETQERLDFTERLIAGAPERAREELH